MRALGDMFAGIALLINNVRFLLALRRKSEYDA
jgi:hypothetical protein